MLAFSLAALVAGALSLTAAIVALTGPGATSAPPPRLSVAEELQARNDRIAFFEQRAAADALDFASLNLLAFEYLQRARATGDVDDYARAEAAATRSLSVLPQDNLNGSLALASVRLVQHDYAAALTLSDEAIVLKPGGAAGYGLKGDALFGLGRYDEADKAYQRQVLLEPDVGALSRLAGLAFIRGDNLNAEDFWKQAIDRGAGSRENQAWAQVQLGRLYFDSGNLDLANKQYEAALQNFPEYIHALAGQAAVMAARGRWDGSARLYETVVQRQPEPEYVIALGDVYARAGREADARRQYDLVDVIDHLYRAAGIDTDLQLALFNADHDQNLDAAVQSAAMAYERAPGVYAADAYAWTLFKTGQVKEADRLMSDALRLGTPDARLHYHAGNVRLALGDEAGARRSLEQALRLNPHFSLLHAPDARQTLAELKGGN
jgi:tetratricopeptide (TPR) repeat protein